MIEFLEHSANIELVICLVSSRISICSGRHCSPFELRTIRIAGKYDLVYSDASKLELTQ